MHGGGRKLFRLLLFPSSILSRSLRGRRDRERLGAERANLFVAVAASIAMATTVARLPAVTLLLELEERRLLLLPHMMSTSFQSHPAQHPSHNKPFSKQTKRTYPHFITYK
jgi:hypothetical protein